MSLSIVYKYSGLPTSITYSHAVASSQTIVFVSSSTNTIWYAPISGGTVSSVRVPDPTIYSSTNTIYGFISVNQQNGHFYFQPKRYEIEYYGAISISIFSTTDFSTFTENVIDFGFLIGYDANNVAYPYECGDQSPMEYISESLSITKLSLNCKYVSPTSYIVYDNSTVYEYTIDSSGISTTTITGNPYYISQNIRNDVDSIKKQKIGTITWYATVTSSTVSTVILKNYSNTTTILTSITETPNCLMFMNSSTCFVGCNNGYIIKFNITTLTYDYIQNTSLKKIERIVKDLNSPFTMIICAEGECYTINTQEFSTNNILSQLYTKPILSGTNNLLSQFASTGFENNGLKCQMAFMTKTYQNILSQLYILNNYSSINLNSQLKIIDISKKGLNSVLISIDVPTREFNIKFKNKKLSDYGIYVMTWSDSFNKKIDMDEDYTKHGWKINRFNYFGSNKISLTGMIITTTITEIQQLFNSWSHESGTLQKRDKFKTTAQLSEFIIEPSKTKNNYRFHLSFICEKPYYEYDKINEVTLTTTITDNVLSPIKLHNTLDIINDNSFLSIKNIDPYNILNYTSSDDCDSIITTAYLPTAKISDISAEFNEPTVNEFASITSIEQWTSIGANFSSVVYFNRFYIKHNLTTTFDTNNLWDIYYKNDENTWIKYTQPFIVKLDKGYIIFDNLYITTKTVKIRYKGTQPIPITASPITVVVPKYHTRLYHAENNPDGYYEYLIDMKNNQYLINLEKSRFFGEMLKFYPNLTYLWVYNPTTTKTLRAEIYYKFNNLFYAL